MSPDKKAFVTVHLWAFRSTYRKSSGEPPVRAGLAVRGIFHGISSTNRGFPTRWAEHSFLAWSRELKINSERSEHRRKKLWKKLSPGVGFAFSLFFHKMACTTPGMFISSHFALWCWNINDKYLPRVALWCYRCLKYQYQTWRSLWRSWRKKLVSLFHDFS